MNQAGTRSLSLDCLFGLLPSHASVQNCQKSESHSCDSFGEPNNYWPIFLLHLPFQQGMRKHCQPSTCATPERAPTLHLHSQVFVAVTVKTKVGRTSPTSVIRILQIFIITQVPYHLIINTSWGCWWPGDKSTDCRAIAMGWPGITSKAVEKSDTPLPSTLPD